jgi:hypothetical protein
MKPVNSPIERAVRPLKKDAVDRAEREAKTVVENCREKLAEAGGDINAVAPYPRSMHISGLQYHMARAKYNLYHSLTVEDKSKGYQRNSGIGNTPFYVVFDDKRIDHFIEQRKIWAAFDYDAFVTKLVNKIGEAKSAKLFGNHVWDHSTLIVVKPDGEKQAWSTKQIVNYSKHGKPFNQWPTRRLKQVPDMRAAA